MVCHTRLTTWGPRAWYHLHVVAFSAFENENAPTYVERAAMHAFILGFSQTLPCRKCRADFIEIIADDVRGGSNASVFSSRAALSRATVRWHNAVNEKLGKRIFDYDKAAIVYTNLNPHCKSKGGRRKLRRAFIACLVVALIILVLTRRRGQSESTVYDGTRRYIETPHLQPVATPAVAPAAMETSPTSDVKANSFPFASS